MVVGVGEEKEKGEGEERLCGCCWCCWETGVAGREKEEDVDAQDHGGGACARKETPGMGACARGKSQHNRAGRHAGYSFSADASILGEQRPW